MTALKSTGPAPKKVIPHWVGDVIEELVLRSRWLLAPLYVLMMVEIGIITVDFVEVMLGVSEPERLTEHTLQTLEMLDITMIANLIWLIGCGSYYVFVDTNYPDASPKKRPRSLTHVSSGLLKEKMAGSLIGVSSVHLLQMFLHLSTTTETVNVMNVGVAVVLHIMFILGLLAFAYTNGLPHHQHKETSINEDHA